MMKAKTKRGVSKAPLAPQKDKMVKRAYRKAMCPTCSYFYRLGFTKCPDCGRGNDEGGTTAVKTR